MSTYFYPENRCPNCNGVFPYHNHPCSGGAPVWPTWPPYVVTEKAPMPADGCRPLKQLTEADVRRIVREELARHFSSQPSSNNP